VQIATSASPVLDVGRGPTPDERGGLTRGERHQGSDSVAGCGPWRHRPRGAAHTTPAASEQIEVAATLSVVTLDRSIGPRCNIGPVEIARRRRSAIVFTVVAALVASVLVAFDVPPAGRLVLFPFATGAAINWLQVVHRFCVAFGTVGIENFGPIGGEVHVDPAQRAADRRRVAQLVVEGSLIGCVVTLALVLG
jgi:hypothetical protein